jgi:polysaccharide export outer membrane protein
MIPEIPLRVSAAALRRFLCWFLALALPFQAAPVLAAQVLPDGARPAQGYPSSDASSTGSRPAGASAAADPAPALAVPGGPALAAAPSAPMPAQPAPAPAAANAYSQYPPFLIGPGDLLNVTVFGEKDLPSSFLVDTGGTIVFPLVGAISVGGMTQVEASQTLSGALAKYLKEPQVTVLVADSAQYTVSVMGNVVKPGKYLIRGLPTLLGVLAEAGGPLPHSALNSAVLVRNNRSIEMSLDVYFDPSTAARAAEPLLYPGDVIYVPVSPWPTFAEWGIIGSLLASAAVLAEAVKYRP